MEPLTHTRRDSLESTWSDSSLDEEVGSRLPHLISYTRYKLTHGRGDLRKMIPTANFYDRLMDRVHEQEGQTSPTSPPSSP